MSLQEISREEQSKPKKQSAINEQSLLARGERVPPKPKLLVLRKPRNLDALALKETLRSPASRAPPVLRKLVELQTRRYRIRRVAGRLVVVVTTRPAFVDSGVEYCKLLFRPSWVDLWSFFFLLLLFLFLVVLFLLREGLVVLRDVDGAREEEVGLGSSGFGVHGEMEFGVFELMVRVVDVVDEGEGGSCCG